MYRWGFLQSGTHEGRILLVLDSGSSDGDPERFSLANLSAPAECSASYPSSKRSAASAKFRYSICVVRVVRLVPYHCLLERG